MAHPWKHYCGHCGVPVIYHFDSGSWRHYHTMLRNCNLQAWPKPMKEEGCDDIYTDSEGSTT
jgi:hypothetical protein